MESRQTDDDPFVTPSGSTWNRPRILPDIHHVTDRRLAKWALTDSASAIALSRCTRPFGALINGSKTPPTMRTHPRATISTDRFL
jgi:hypothetical protein